MCRRPRNGVTPVTLAGIAALALLDLVATSHAGAQTASRAQERPPAAPAPGRPEPKSRPRGAELRVTSKAAADLLRPPPSGSGRYDPGAIDWREVPPWRQTTFFGIRAQGQFFVYVVDCSGSMLDDDRLIRAKGELRQSINRLQYPQRFHVIFYNDHPIPMLGDLPRSADLTAKNQMSHWLRLIAADGGTEPRGAMAMALSLRPDAIFLLSDGAFPEGAVESIATRNPRKIPIHCIDLSGGLAGDQLARIARGSGGQYASRPPRSDELTP
jgi:hypothetical protein